MATEELFSIIEAFAMSRPTVDETLMEIARVMSRRGTCSRRQVGAVIADHRGVILSTGYNSALSGLPHCPKHEDYQPCDVSEHAERSAIYWAARRGVAIEGTTLATTDSPCYGCARGIVQAGIRRVIYWRSYRDDQGLLLLMAAGVEVTQLDFEDTK